MPRGLKGPLSPGRDKRAGTDSDRDSELELDYTQCKYSGQCTVYSGQWTVDSGQWTECRMYSANRRVYSLKAVVCIV